MSENVMAFLIWANIIAFVAHVWLTKWIISHLLRRVSDLEGAYYSLRAAVAPDFERQKRRETR